MLLALHTPGMAAAMRMMASLKEGSARSPMSSAFDSWARSAATPAKMAAIIRDAIPSQRLYAVRRDAVVPGRANEIHNRAADFSMSTTKGGGSFDWRNASHQLKWRLDCLNALAP